MIPVIINPGPEEVAALIKRPAGNIEAVIKDIEWIVNGVKQGGDAALRKYNALFAGVSVDELAVSEEEWNTSATLSSPLKQAIDNAFKNIYAFHEAQVQQEIRLETMPGVLCWRKSVPVQKVGLYIPGGSAPLFSTLLMLGIPAVIAGCKEIVVCTPPAKDGTVHPAILYAAQKIGIKNIWKVGGVQAVAGMAFGTESIPKVYKIFGPGNRYVTAAKALVQSLGTTIDMPAGPSEVAIIADDTALASFVAADLLAQAEHGPDSQVMLVTTSDALLQQVKAELEQQLPDLPRRDIATESLKQSKLVLVPTLETAIDIINEYAPEHLIVNTAEPDTIAESIVNAGSVFIGNYSPESVGDYASGTNHTLPTNGYASAYSGVSLESFQKKITYQKLSQEGLKNIGETVQQMAMAEGLQAHAQSVTIRLNQITAQ